MDDNRHRGLLPRPQGHYEYIRIHWSKLPQFVIAKYNLEPYSTKNTSTLNFANASTGYLSPENYPKHGSSPTSPSTDTNNAATPPAYFDTILA